MNYTEQRFSGDGIAYGANVARILDEWNFDFDEANPGLILQARYNSLEFSAFTPFINRRIEE